MSGWDNDWGTASSASAGCGNDWGKTLSEGGGDRVDGWGSSDTSAPTTNGGGGRGGRGGGGDRGCFNCGESGHMSRDCTAPRKPREGGGGGGGGGDRGCFNCGESGHMSRDCTAPRKPREGGGGGRSCYNCGGTGHISRECPQPKKPRENGGGGGCGGGWNSVGTSSVINGWGSSEPAKPKSDDGWWGPSEPVKPTGVIGGWGLSEPAKATGDVGGWGPSKSASSNNDDGGWGPSEPASFKKDDEGWGSNENNNSGFGGEDGSRKRFKRDDENGCGAGNTEERPAPYRPEELNLEEEAKFQANGVGENFHRYHDQEVTCIPEGIVTPVEKFEDIVASKLLLDNIKSQKYSEMTPIQKWAMPIIMNDHDLIGCAQTGSGKTAAFLLPVLQTLLNSDLQPNDPNNECQNPYCLILSPTRELANQIHVHASMLAKDSIIQCRVIYGQMATAHLKSKLQQGCHILVATVGRLKDFVQRGWIGFSNIKYIILDEGDRLVDDGFSTEIRGFFEHPSMPPKEKRQTLFFSATFKQETQLQAKEYLKDPFVFLTVGRIGAANLDIKQEFLKVTRQEKKRELKRILSEVPEDKKTIVFTQTKSAADMLAGFFTALNLSSTSIHGDRHQSQREQAIKSFKRGEKRFLISSPVGNRGLDLPFVSLVINYDLPDNIDEYVHRIGRTGRAGHTGRALSFFDEERDREILPSLIEILTEAKQEIPTWMTGEEENTATLDNGAGGGDEWDTARATNASVSVAAPVDEEW